MDSIWNIVREMGLGVTLAIGIFTAFFFLLKWVLETSKDMLIKMNEERIKYLNVLDGYSSSLREHTQADKVFQAQVNEGHKYQREEHAKMLLCLNEVEKSLGRINGYKEK